MDTSLTTKQIELCLRNSGWWNRRTDIMIPNLSWGMLNHEADFVVITKSGYLTEIEIKRSFADLKADFKKDIFHRDERVYRFAYCLPLSIKEKALKLFEEQYGKVAELYGHDRNYNYTTKFYPYIIWYNERGHLSVEPKKLDTRSGARKLFLEEIVTAGRLASLRYWDLANKVTDMPNEQKLF